MKTIVIFLMLCCVSLYSPARDWYRIYLISQINTSPKFTHPLNAVAASSSIISDIHGAGIPRFVRPKGAIFCRMEDYLTTKTKVWIKVGVK